MAPADFWRPIGPPSGLPSPSGQNARSPGVRRVTFLPSTRRIYTATFRMTIGFSAVRHLAPGSPCLICASCSSGRKFASSFLQTPPHGGCPCCSAWSSRHQGLQRTFTSKSLPGSVSLAGSQTTCTMHVASRHARRTDRRGQGARRSRCPSIFDVEHPKVRKHRWVRCIAGRSRKLVRYAG